MTTWAVSSAVERLVYTERVGGSIPSLPTILSYPQNAIIMTLRRVLTHPHPHLRYKAKSVQKVDEAVRQLMDDMVETMRFHDGCGLAATQIGDKRRVIVMELPASDHQQCEKTVVYKMANPQVVLQSAEKIEFAAGCLSMPGLTVPVVRRAWVDVSYIDENNELRQTRLEDIQAHAVLHEIDHLNGVVMLDYLPGQQKKKAIAKLKKMLSFTS